MTIGNQPPTVRADGRGPTDLRPITLTLDVLKWAEGSCRIRVGDTEGGPACGALGEATVLTGPMGRAVFPAAVVGQDRGQVGLGEPVVDRGMPECPVDLGGAEHAHVDNRQIGIDHAADWLA